MILIAQKYNDINIIADIYNSGLTNESLLVLDSGTKYYTVVDAIYENKLFDSLVQIAANNVTFRNCKFTGSEYFHIKNSAGATGSKFINCEFDGQLMINQSACNQEMDGLELTNCRIKNFGADGIKLGNNTKIINCLLDEFVYFEGAHSDGMQCAGYSNIIVRGNTVIMPNTLNNCIRIATDTGNTSNVLIEYNYCNGAGYTYVIGDNGTNTINNVTVNNNICGSNYTFGKLDSTVTSIGSDPINFIEPSISETGKLYVSSVWENEGVYHLSASNFTGLDLFLYVKTANLIESHQINSYTYDNDVTLSDTEPEYIIAYSGLVPDNPNDHIRFVNFTEEDIYLPAENSITPTYTGRLKYNAIECDVAGTPTTSGGYFYVPTYPEVVIADANEHLYDKTDPFNPVAKILVFEDSVYGDQFFVSATKGIIALYNKAQTGDSLVRINKALGFNEPVLLENGQQAILEDGLTLYVYKSNINLVTEDRIGVTL